MYTLLSDATCTAIGIFKVADVAGILSPLYPHPSLPAIVVIIPLVKNASLLTIYIHKYTICIFQIPRI